ncbi:helix-turn-helix domain-containing protein [Mangrovibacillus cuniculi]|uniref:Helix-turn-helix domain-containing protein n=1 Tax=Mangrovibacillus cuniculi TaxID=2593652 RepID=A0A7S8CAJ0_9BACI|nr:RodZ domain-containing protein [Mangrovibacillus cuniculi]QPC46410.1 helix-turn-helix domain-containing protein [Mangrovibacillus cuniculi]
MTELGNRLKEARESKGFSLDDLQSMTKIQKRYLIGIEEGNYEMMPGKFYVRAFIKQYAEAVGLSSEEIFEEFKQDIPTAHEDDLPEKISRVQTRKTQVNSSSSKVMDFLPRTLAIVAIVAVVFIVWLIFSSLNENSQPLTDESEQTESTNFGDNEEIAATPDEEEVEEDTTEEEPVEEEVEETVTQAVEAINVSGGTATLQVTGATERNITLTTTGETWLTVEENSERLYYGALAAQGEQPGEFTAELKSDSVYLNIGRTLDAELYINGEKVDFPSNPSDQVQQKITIEFVPEEQ